MPLINNSFLQMVVLYVWFALRKTFLNHIQIYVMYVNYVFRCWSYYFYRFVGIKIILQVIMGNIVYLLSLVGSRGVNIDGRLIKLIEHIYDIS